MNSMFGDVVKSPDLNIIDRASRNKLLFGEICEWWPEPWFWHCPRLDSWHSLPTFEVDNGFCEASVDLNWPALANRFELQINMFRCFRGMLRNLRFRFKLLQFPTLVQSPERARMWCNAHRIDLPPSTTHTRGSLSAKVHAAIKRNDFIRLTQFDIVAAIKPRRVHDKVSQSSVCNEKLPNDAFVVRPFNSTLFVRFGTLLVLLLFGAHNKRFIRLCK